MTVYRVYTNLEHLTIQRSPQLNDLCMALWSQDAKVIRPINSTWKFEPASSPDQADLWLLPLWWNFYVEKKLVQLASKEAEQAMRENHRLIVFSQGDFAANLPFDNSILFERGAYASRRTSFENIICAIPPFIPDYTRLYCGGEVQIREKSNIPVVGFCGQAGGTLVDFARRELATQLRKLSYALHWRKWEPAPFETTRLRQKILNNIAKHPNIKSNFIIRRLYRAGYWASAKDPFHPTRLEFIQNILNSDYTVCVRGNGNFSVRFYEALALGRIPIFVNTDCILPFDNAIDYRQYCVWVEENEISHIGEKVLDFHSSLSPAQFKDLQKACYSLWRDRLSKDSFFAYFSEYINFLRRNVNEHQDLKTKHLATS